MQTACTHTETLDSPSDLGIVYSATMHHLRVRTFVVTLPLALAAATLALMGACSSSHPAAGFTGDASDDGTVAPERDAGKGRPLDGSPKPPPAARDAGPMMMDARPPPIPMPPPVNKPDGGGDAGKLLDAGGIDASIADAGGSTSSLTPLDSVDKSLMPDFGLDVGACSGLKIPDGTGLCKSNASSGQDFVEGCVGTEAFILDCARYDTADLTRSTCSDDGKKVGCILVDVTAVASFEKSQTGSAFDLFHECPSSWEGYGNCEGDFVSMCVGGRDLALDCAIYNTQDFTYTCGKNASGQITCL